MSVIELSDQAVRIFLSRPLGRNLFLVVACQTYLYEDVNKSTVEPVSNVSFDVRPAVGDLAHRQETQRPEEDPQTSVMIAYSVSQV